MHPSKLKSHIMSAFRSTLGDKKVTYISGPISTGRVYLDWYRTHGKFLSNKEEYDKSYYEDVIKVNGSVINSVAEKIRSNGETVINTSDIYVEEWDASHYMDMWYDVMSLHVAKVVLCPGWNYSQGSIREFVHAFSSGIDCFDIDDKIVDFSSGSEMVESAYEDFLKHGVHIDDFRLILRGEFR